MMEFKSLNLSISMKIVNSLPKHNINILLFFYWVIKFDTLIVKIQLDYEYG